jgi:hypothetical protein
MQAIRSSESWVLTRATRRSVPEDGIHHSHRRQNLKTYIPTDTDDNPKRHDTQCRYNASYAGNIIPRRKVLNLMHRLVKLKNLEKCTYDDSIERKRCRSKNSGFMSIF